MRAARPISGLLAAFTVMGALAVAACGSSSSGDSAQSLLRQTFSGGKSVKSGRLNVALNANLQGVQGVSGPVAIRLSGPFQSSGPDALPRFDFTLGLTTAGQAFTASGISTGEAGFVRFQGQPYALSPQLFEQFKKGYLQSQKQAGKKKGSSTFASLGIDPSRWLRSPRKAGEQDVGGTKTIRITSAVDIPRFLTDLDSLLSRAGSLGQGAQVPQRLTPAQRQAVEKAVRDATVDVYTGADDKMLRRLDLRVRLNKTAKSGGGTVRFTLEIDDLNADQKISAPAGARPLAELLAQLRGSGAAGAGTGTSTTPAPSTSTTPSSGASPKYADCITKAGSDLRKVQACAQYL
jgi:hypothetical protein